ncbi:MAG: hypothetical protein GY782_08695 [Gammaproteobacteria bacterium]|nr:hypothetical protein [Gammaproteobacteria bacterium]
MDTIYSAKVKLEGITTLLLDKPVLGNKGTNKERSWEEDLNGSIYWTSNGADPKYMVLPTENVMAMLSNGSRGEKIGKLYLKRLLSIGIWINDYEYPFYVNGKKVTWDDVKQNEYHLTRYVVINGKKIEKPRVQLPIGWTFSFDFDVKDNKLQPELVERFLERCGIVEGMGVWRPGSPKPGRHGMFIVKEFETD